VERQLSIADAERKVENQQSLPSQLKSLQADIEEKKTRLTKIKNEMGSAKYDAQLADRTEKAKVMEERREALNTEIRTLSLQADSRAKLDLKRGEVRSKNKEILSTSVVSVHRQHWLIKLLVSRLPTQSFVSWRLVQSLRPRRLSVTWIEFSGNCHVHAPIFII